VAIPVALAVDDVSDTVSLRTLQTGKHYIRRRRSSRVAPGVASLPARPPHNSRAILTIFSGQRVFPAHAIMLQYLARALQQNSGGNKQ
jgi:hypothetical protein